MKTAGRTAAVTVFLTVFVMLFSLCDRVLCRKETEGWWNVTAKIDGFYNSPENEYDVMFFGASHAYCSFNPLVIWKETGGSGLWKSKAVRWKSEESVISRMPLQKEGPGTSEN